MEQEKLFKELKHMSFVTVDQKKCAHDGICAAECPVGILFMNNESLPEAVDGAEKKCIKCGHCVAACPHQAISVPGINVADCPPIKKELLISADQIEQLIKSRRSIRKYRDKKIDREKLSKLIEIARYAPTGGNSQQVQWLVVNSRDEVKKIAAATIDFMKVIIKDGHPLAERYNLPNMVKAWESGVDVIFRGAPSLIVAHAPKEYGLATVDCTAALSYLDIAASSLDLGCCWAGFFMVAGSSPSVMKILDLPEGNICAGGLMIGYPKYDYHRIPPRKDAQIMWKD
jgi:nitroreductase/NAD-dependent dihydropyrimidine dehydrogenase PreA subunit